MTLTALHLPRLPALHLPSLRNPANRRPIVPEPHAYSPVDVVMSLGDAAVSTSVEAQLPEVLRLAAHLRADEIEDLFGRLVDALAGRDQANHLGGACVSRGLVDEAHVHQTAATHFDGVARLLARELAGPRGTTRRWTGAR